MGRHDWANFTFHTGVLEQSANNLILEMATGNKWQIASYVNWLQNVPENNQIFILAKTWLLGGTVKMKAMSPLWPSPPSWVSLCPRYEASRLFFLPETLINGCYIPTIVLEAENMKKTWQVVKMSVTQSCPTLCDPMDCSSTGSSVHGIFQVRIVEWVVIPFSRGSFWLRDWIHISCLAGGFLTKD